MKRILILTALVVALMCVVATPAFANNGLRQHGNGKYARLTAQWWQWILEQPAAGNPNLDTTGADAGNGQPGKRVFFVAGTFGDSVTRAFTVPAGKALFFPVLNNVGLAPQPAPQPKPNGNQIPQLRALAAQFIDDATEIHATLDGASLLDSVRRVKSPVFHVTIPEGGLGDPGTLTAVSDGYWLYLSPLPPGTYTLNFGGASVAEGETLAIDVTDVITVQ